MERITHTPRPPLVLLFSRTYKAMAISIRTMLHRRMKTTLRLLCVGLISMVALPAFSAVEINYSYDDLNRLTAVTRADGPVVNYQYDESGNAINQGVSNSPDTDADQVANFVDPDDDGDGMSDSFEVQYGLNPLNAADAALDSDGDGISNLAEYQAGTNPLQNDNPVPVPTLPEWGMMILALVLMFIGMRHTSKQGR